MTELTIRRKNNYETCTVYSDKESLLHSRKKNHREGADAPLCWLQSAQCTGIYQKLEQCFVKGAGTNYAATGRYTGKGVFTITEVKAGKGSSAGWGRLKSGAGWISLDYAKRV